MDNVYREMLSVALAQAHEAQQRFEKLAEKVKALQEELRRYTARQVDDASVLQRE